MVWTHCRLLLALVELKRSVDCLVLVQVYSISSFQSLFPVIYLLIKHHYEILRLARTKIIHLDDFYKASESMLYVGDAVQFRYDDLKGVSTASSSL